MKIMVRTPVLRAAISQLMSIIPRLTVLPILLDIKLQVEDGKLTMMAGDLETYIRVKVPLWGMIAELEGVLVPARSLSRFVPKGKRGVVCIEQPILVRDCLSLSYEWENSGGGRAQADFRFLPSTDDFPPLPVIDQITATKSVDGRWFCSMLNIVGSCASPEDTRPVLTGICMENGAMAAADGFRLAVVESEKLDFGLPDGVREIIPWKALRIVARVFSRSNDIRITFGTSTIAGGKLVSFEGDDMFIVTRTIEGKYPDYKQLIPQEDKPVISFHAPVMQQFLSMVQTSQGIIRLEFDSDKQMCNISCYDEEIASYQMSLPAKIETWPNPLRIAFNEKFLAGALSHFVTCNMVISSGTQPGRFWGDVEGLTLVLMPMFVDWDKVSDIGKCKAKG